MNDLQTVSSLLGSAASPRDPRAASTGGDDAFDNVFSRALLTPPRPAAPEPEPGRPEPAPARSPASRAEAEPARTRDRRTGAEAPRRADTAEERSPARLRSDSAAPAPASGLAPDPRGDLSQGLERAAPTRPADDQAPLGSEVSDKAGSDRPADQRLVSAVDLLLVAQTDSLKTPLGVATLDGAMTPAASASLSAELAQVTAAGFLVGAATVLDAPAVPASVTTAPLAIASRVMATGANALPVPGDAALALANGAAPDTPDSTGPTTTGAGTSPAATDALLSRTGKPTHQATAVGPLVSGAGPAQPAVDTIAAVASAPSVASPPAPDAARLPTAGDAGMPMAADARALLAASAPVRTPADAPPSGAPPAGRARKASAAGEIGALAEAPADRPNALGVRLAGLDALEPRRERGSMTGSAGEREWTFAAMASAHAAGGREGIVTPSNAGLLPTTAATPASAAPQAMVQASLASPVGLPAFAEELSQRVVMFAGRHVQSAELAVTPADLGPITIAIEVRGNEASLAFGAQHAQTRAAIEDALPRLREMFAGQGLHLAQAQVGDQRRQDNGRSSNGPGAGNRDPGRIERAGALGVGTSLPAAYAARGTGLIDIHV